MSLRDMEVQYVGDTLYLPPFEREVKHIVVRNEDVKDWEYFEPERTCHDRNASAREHGAYLFMWRCSNCDESYDTEMGKLNFCPNCGARVTPKNSETTPKVVS